MKKVFDQTVRDLKREVNKKVLKVPAIEQKVLDATSNEPWGPHGSLLADIAQATRNYAEFQIIMSIIWKRINDTGKNWRHVYKGLIVLEYLVAHGSDKVIDEIKEHSYQISTLSDFQYLSSSGRDEGSNVRRKSQSLVALVNDRDRIQEARQKASANRDKYRTGGRYGDQYDDERYHGSYGSREDYRNGYRDDDRYGKRNTNERDGDRYGRDAENYRGNDDYHYGSKTNYRGSEKGRSFDEDDRYSSRSGGGRTDETSQEDRKLEHKFSGPNHDAPPTYEEAVAERSHLGHTERDEESGRTSAAKSSDPPLAPQPAPSETVSVSQKVEVEKFDEFDPRGSNAGPGLKSDGAEMDFFGLSGVESISSLALVPVSASTSSQAEELPANSHSSDSQSAQFDGFNQPGENPFGEPPFKAMPTPQETTNINLPQQASSPPLAFSPFPSSLATTITAESPFLPQNLPARENDTLASPLHLTSSVNQYDLTSSFAPSALPSGLVALQPNPVSLESNSNATLAHQAFPPAPSEGVQTNSIPAQSYPPGLVAPIPGFPSNPFPAQGGLTAPAVPSQSFPHGHFPQTQRAQSVPAPTSQAGSGQNAAAYSSLGADLLNMGPWPVDAQAKSAPPPAKEKFETKSTVWADTLSRGLVDLNISGPKTNPLADIGVDFDSINRKERRKEKEKAAPGPVSTVSMGKAMGAGSGMGRAAAVGLTPPPNPMVGAGIGMGMGMGMGGFGGGINRPMGMSGMGPGMNMNVNVNMNMSMRPGAMGPGGFPPSQIVQGNGYNQMAGPSGFGSQQQFSGYR